MFDSKKTGVALPEILMPNNAVDMEKWAVVAVDQFTSQPDYWDSVAKKVGVSPSMLHIVLPEIFLNSPNVSELISETKDNMKKYLSNDVFVKYPKGIVLTERTMGDIVRKGILLAVDLDQYDFNIDKKPLIRATEKTLLERIPPRVAIRKGALIESPHVLVLMDDKNDSVIGPLHNARGSFEKLYDFELMMDGGHINGYFSQDETLIAGLSEALNKLEVRDGMKFCVGDGNHSLATAKAVWDSVKDNLDAFEYESHPLRYAMCEFVNIHDAGIQFMPIHRVIFKVNPSACLQYITDHLAKCGINAKLGFSKWTGGTSMISSRRIPFLSKESAGNIEFDTDVTTTVVAMIQDALDDFLKESLTSSIDYIHGEKAFEELSRNYDTLGLFFNAMDKSTFFDTVIDCGVLPKKTFSMGEAEQKRYYLECRMICTQKDREE